MPLTPRAQATLFESHATACETLAKTASDEQARTLLLDLAAGWRQLATLQHSLADDRQLIDNALDRINPPGREV